MTADLAARIGALTGVAVTGLRAAGAQHGYRHLTAQFADGREAFVKVAFAADGERDARTAAAFAAEASGLRWLAEASLARPAPPGPASPGPASPGPASPGPASPGPAWRGHGGAAVPEVLGVDDSVLVIELLPPGGPSPQAARAFGAALARTHAAGAPAFGAPWPGFIASLPLDNTPPDNAGETDWATWYARRRIVPYLRRAHDAGTLPRSDVRLVERVVARISELAGPPEPVSRLHGDLWSGNVFWSGGRGWLIDPAAHGGHRETDLAMLALFGAPHLDEILRGYTETAPLADGWRARVPLHQLHPLLVHVCLFGSGYASELAAAARAALAG